MRCGTLLQTLIAALLLAAVVQAAPDRKTNMRLATVFAKIQAQLIADEGDQGGPSSSEAGAGRKLETATFGGGCFWCTEAVFGQLRGVEQVVSGYSGGRVPHPTYQQVLTGLTGHAEVVQIQYDPQVISYAKLLEVFWRTHDPTTLNRQGPDVGTQYRSVIFCHTPRQRELAERCQAILNRTRVFNAPVVTQVADFEAFYPAEKYHQDYFTQNRRASYCRYVIQPKMRQFRRDFREELDRGSSRDETR
jgi:peptide-methionine (S)-S-oxide reductase